jgi:hypothetical protein
VISVCWTQVWHLVTTRTFHAEVSSVPSRDAVSRIDNVRPLVHASVRVDAGNECSVANSCCVHVLPGFTH